MPVLLNPMSHNVKREFQLVADSDCSVQCRSSLHVVVSAIDGELAPRAQVVSFQRDISGNHDVTRDPMQSKITTNLRFVVPGRSQLARDVGAFEDYLGILWRFQVRAREFPY